MLETKVFNIVKDNDRYIVADYLEDEWTFSMTILYPDRGTFGHRHLHEETYSFLSGYGELIVDKQVYVASKGVTIKIPCNSHHQVRNLSKLEPLIFASIFQGKRS